MVVIGVGCKREDQVKIEQASYALTLTAFVALAAGEPETYRQTPPRQSAVSARWDQVAALDSALRHLRRDSTGEKVLAHRSEKVDHLRLFSKEGFVLDPTGYHGDVSRFNCSLLGPNPQANCAFNHPNKLLLRMLVSGSLRARLHSPMDHRCLVCRI
jgi:hypothetical protein